MIGALLRHLKGFVRMPGVIASLGFFFFLSYTGFVLARTFAFHEGVYRSEVEVNVGLRLEAAEWIKKNTPPDARILVGYTGLGVVGGMCGRYVLDIGALINPDIFPYYSDSQPMGEKRFKRIIQYAANKGINYLVTVPGIGPDPGDFDGIIEEARIRGSQGHRGPFNEIVIYKVE